MNKRADADFPDLIRLEQEDRTRIDLQTGLLLFTVSTVVMIFAGGALIAVLAVIWALLF